MPRQLTLKPKGRKPLDLGEKVAVETVRLSPPGAGGGCPAGSG